MVRTWIHILTLRMNSHACFFSVPELLCCTWLVGLNLRISSPTSTYRFWNGHIYIHRDILACASRDQCLFVWFPGWNQYTLLCTPPPMYRFRMGVFPNNKLVAARFATYNSNSFATASETRSQLLRVHRKCAEAFGTYSFLYQYSYIAEWHLLDQIVEEPSWPQLVRTSRFLLYPDHQYSVSPCSQQFNKYLHDVWKWFGLRLPPIIRWCKRREWAILYRKYL